MPTQPLDSVNSAPIGVFDSGVGGLSVVQEIRAQLPHEDICYLADTANVPYGGRSDQEIQQLSAQAVDWLYAQGCKIVVVACNTASAFSLTSLRAHYGDRLPIIGLVPALKPAVLGSKTKIVGVLATQGTLRGQLLQNVIRDIAIPRHVSVLTAVSPNLVPLVEAGLCDTDACAHELQRVLQPLADAHADYLVLGCTHYPFLAPAIERIFPNTFTLIDSGAAVALQTLRILTQRQRLNPTATQGQLQLYATGDQQQAAQVVIDMLLQTSTTVQAAIY